MSESAHDSSPPTGERSTERRLVPTESLVENDPPSARTGNLDPFRDALQRGGELLEGGQLEDAMEALERAISLRPREAKAQDLLAAVYFRLGLFDRAIAAYEALERAYPENLPIKLNLAICSLRAAHYEAARATLSDIVRTQPDHRRAWSYLGLVHERMGEFEQAQIAFERGGLSAIARRLTDRKSRATVPAPALFAAHAPAVGSAKATTDTLFRELDAGELDLALADPSMVWSEGIIPSPTIGYTMGRVPDAVKSPFAKTLPPPSVRQVMGEGGNIFLREELETSLPPSMPRENPSPEELKAKTVAPPDAVILSHLATEHDARDAHGASDTRDARDSHHAEPSAPTRTSNEVVGVLRPSGTPLPPVAIAAPPAIAAASRDAALIFPEGHNLALHPSGVVLARTSIDPEHSFASRLEALRVVKGGITTTVLERRTRDNKTTGEVLGGLASPLVKLSGNAEIVLGPRAGHQLVPLHLDRNLAFLREELLLGFELSLSYESGRLAGEDGHALAVVQVRGRGSVVLELHDGFTTFEATSGHPVTVRREWVIGWIGRLLPRALSASDSPGGQRGLVMFTGEGSVLVAGR